jgi:hypothetical protein
MSWKDVPEPSEQLKAMYSEIFTEVTKDGLPKEPLDGRPLNPKEHLHMVLVWAEAGLPRSEFMRTLSGPHVRGGSRWHERGRERNRGIHGAPRGGGWNHSPLRV